MPQRVVALLFAFPTREDPLRGVRTARGHNGAPVASRSLGCRAVIRSGAAATAAAVAAVAGGGGGGVNRNGNPRAELFPAETVVAVRNTYGKFWLAQLIKPLYDRLELEVEVQWYESTEDNPLIYKFTKLADKVAAVSIHPQALKLVPHGADHWQLADHTILDKLEKKYATVA